MEKRQSTTNNTQDGLSENERNQRNLSSQNRNNDESNNSNNPFGLLQNHSAQDGVNINSVRSKTIKKKRKNTKKGHNMIDGEYEVEFNS